MLKVNNNLPMYNSSCNTGVKPSSRSAAPSTFGMSIRGASIYITLGQGIHTLTAGIYDCSGKLIANVLNRSVGEGTYAFAPMARNVRLLSQQMYLVRVSDGSHTQTFRMLNVGQSNIASKVAASSSADPVSLRKILAVDGLRVGKTGYLPDTAQLTTYGDNVGNVKITALNIEARIDSLLALMTLDEKIGQLMQPSEASGMGSDVAKNYLLGSYLKGEGASALMTGALSTRLKIPLLVGNDWVHGGRHVYFPHEIGLGCMNDTLLTELAYRIYAMCCIPLYNNCCFAPCIDAHRSDFSGRVYEGFAETPELTVPLTRAAVRGLQGTDLSSGYTMIATLKHWAAGGGTNGGGGWGNANTAPNLGVLAQIHFPPFYAGVKAGAGSVMTGYQQVFGTVMSVNKQLVTDTLKTGWGFDGFVLTDWGTSGGQEAACINAGHDLCMTVDPTTFPATIKAAVPGTIPQARIDDAVRRTLRAKFRLGLFENPWPNLNLNNYLASAEYRNVARTIVRKSLVLLKNDNNTLPLSKTAHIYVAGAWADNIGYQCGGWSATGATFASNNTNVCATGDEGWQGTANAHGLLGSTTILQGLQAVDPNVTYNVAGTNIPANTDVIVVAVGETPYAEGSGDKTDISLPANLQTLVQTCAAFGKPVVTILITGRPNVLGTIPTSSKALVAAWLPGTEGEGISDVLFGDYNFSGKLSVTWPVSNAQEPINTGNMGDNVGTGGAPLYAYGWGMSY
jgi:beta-glucosidase